MDDEKCMVAIVQGVRNSGLTVALMNKATLINSLKRSRKNPVTKTSVETSTDDKIHTSVQVSNGHYTSSYQLAHCGHAPTSPPISHSEYPFQRTKPSRSRGNFEVSRYASGKTSEPHISQSFRNNGQGSNLYCTPPSNATEAFIYSLRKYTSDLPFPSSVSSELVQRLLDYTQTKHLSRHNSRSNRSLRGKNSHQGNDSKSKMAPKTSKHIQTYTRILNQVSSKCEEKVKNHVLHKGKTEEQKKHRSSSNVEIRNETNQFSESYDYLRVTGSRRRHNAGHHSKVLYINDVKKCIRDTIRSMVENPKILYNQPICVNTANVSGSQRVPSASEEPITVTRVTSPVRAICPSLRSRYIEHRRSEHNEEPIEANASRLNRVSKPKDKNDQDNGNELHEGDDENNNDVENNDDDENNDANDNDNDENESDGGNESDDKNVLEETEAQSKKTRCRPSEMCPNIMNRYKNHLRSHHKHLDDQEIPATDCAAGIPLRSNPCGADLPRPLVCTPPLPFLSQRSCGIPRRCPCKKPKRDPTEDDNRDASEDEEDNTEDDENDTEEDKEESSEDATEAEKQVLEWLKDVPISADDSNENFVQRMSLVKDLVHKLSNLIEDDNYEEKVKEEIRKFVDDLLTWLPEDENDQEPFKDNLVQSLYAKLLEDDEPDNLNDIVAKWLDDIDMETIFEDNNGLKQDEIVKQIADHLELILQRRDSSVEDVRDELLQLLPEIFGQNEDTDEIRINEITDKLVSNLDSERRQQEKVRNKFKLPSNYAKPEQKNKKQRASRPKTSDDEVLEKEINGFLNSLSDKGLSLSDNKKNQLRKNILGEIKSKTSKDDRPADNSSYAPKSKIKPLNSNDPKKYEVDAYDKATAKPKVNDNDKVRAQAKVDDKDKPDKRKALDSNRHQPEKIRQPVKFYDDTTPRSQSQSSNVTKTKFDDDDDDDDNDDDDNDDFISAKSTHSAEMKYMNELKKVIRNWLNEISSTNPPYRADIEKASVDDLAGDIADWQKYIQLLTNTPMSDKEKIEHLKYEIHRWMNKFANNEILENLRPKSSILIDKIKNILVPKLPGKHLKEQQTQNNTLTPKIVDDKAIKDIISKLINDMDSNVVSSIDKQKLKKKMPELIEDVQPLLSNKQMNETKHIIDVILPHIRSVNKKVKEQELVRAAERLKSLVKKRSPTPASRVPDDTNEFIEKNLIDACQDWLKKQPIYKKIDPEAKRTHERVMTDLIKGVSAIIEDSSDAGNDNIDNILVKEILKHLQKLPTDSKLKTNTRLKKKIPKELLEYLKRLPAFKKLAQHHLHRGVSPSEKSESPLREHRSPRVQSPTESYREPRTPLGQSLSQNSRERRSAPAHSLTELSLQHPDTRDQLLNENHQQGRDNRGQTEFTQQRRDTRGQSPIENIQQRRDTRGQTPIENRQKRRDTRGPSPIENTQQRRDTRGQSPIENIQQRRDTRGQTPIENRQKRRDTRGPSPIENTQQRRGTRGQSPIENIQQCRDTRGQTPIENRQKRRDTRGQSPIEYTQQRRDTRSQSPIENTQQRRDTRGQSPIENTQQRRDIRGQSPIENIQQRRDTRSQSPIENIQQRRDIRGQTPIENIQQRRDTRGQSPIENTQQRRDTRGQSSYRNPQQHQRAQIQSPIAHFQDQTQIKDIVNKWIEDYSPLVEMSPSEKNQFANKVKDFVAILDQLFRTDPTNKEKLNKEVGNFFDSISSAMDILKEHQNSLESELMKKFKTMSENIEDLPSGTNRFIIDAVEHWAKTLILPESVNGCVFKYIVNKAQNELISTLSNIFVYRDEVPLTNIKRIFQEATSNFLEKLPINPYNTTEMEILADSLLDTFKEYSRKHYSIVQLAKKKAADVLLLDIKSWIKNLPIEADTREEKEKADKIKQQTESKLIHKIGELNMNPEVMNDDFLYEDMLQDQVDSLLTDIRSQNIENNKERLMKELIDKVKKARSKIRGETSGQVYRQQLRESISNTLAFQDLSADEQASLEAMKDDLVDAFINLQYAGDNEEQKIKLRYKIRDEINKFCDNYLRHHYSSPIDTRKLNQDLYNALKNISEPNSESFKDEIELLKIKDLVNDWVEELPLKGQNGQEKLQTNKIISILVKKLHDMEIEKEVIIDVDNKMKNVITKFLRKVPLIVQNDIDRYAERLLDNLKETEDLRRQDVTTRHSIESNLDYWDYVPLVPPCMLSMVDRAHLRRLREKMPKPKQKLVAKVSSKDSASQTELRSWLGACLDPKRSLAQQSAQTHPNKVQEVGSQVDISPHVIIKEYYWDPADKLFTKRPPCTASASKQSGPKPCISSFCPSYHSSLQGSINQVTCDSQYQIPCASVHNRPRTCRPESHETHSLGSQHSCQYNPGANKFPKASQKKLSSLHSGPFQQSSPRSLLNVTPIRDNQNPGVFKPRSCMSPPSPCSRLFQPRCSNSARNSLQEEPSGSRERIPRYPNPRKPYLRQDNLLSSEENEPGPSCAHRRPRVKHLGSFDNTSHKSCRNHCCSWNTFSQHDGERYTAKRCAVASDEEYDEREKKKLKYCRCKQKNVPRSGGRNHNIREDKMKNCFKCCGVHCPYPSYMFFKQ